MIGPEARCAPSVRLLTATVALVASMGCGATSQSRVHADRQGVSEGPRRVEPALLQRLDATVTSCVGSFPNRSLETYLHSVGARLESPSARGGTTFRLLSDGRVWAFGIAGRYVYVSLGLVVRLRSEAELAAVLAHEMGHGGFEQSGERIAAIQAGTWSVYRALEHEVEADRRAITLLSAAGYDPAVLATVLRRLASFQLTSRAEPLRERARLVEDSVGEPVGDDGDRRPAFFRALDGAVLSVPGPTLVPPSGWGVTGSPTSPCDPLVLVDTTGSSRITVSGRQRRTPDAVTRQRRVAAPEGFELYVGGEPEAGVIDASVRLRAGPWRTLRFEAAGDLSEADALRVLLSMPRVSPVGTRVHLVWPRADETLRALHARACPEADLALVESLTGVSADAGLGPNDVARCLEEWSVVPSAVRSWSRHQAPSYPRTRSSSASTAARSSGTRRSTDRARSSIHSAASREPDTTV